MEYFGYIPSTKKNYPVSEALERSLNFIHKNQRYVSSVVFYSADYLNLLPAVPHKDNRRLLCRY